MKKTYYLIHLFMLIVGFMACNKKHDDQPATNITGKWRLIQARGGFSGRDVITYDGKTILTLNRDSSFIAVHDATVLDQGTFRIRSAQSVFDATMQPAIKFVGSQASPDKLITVSKDSLLLSDNHVEPYFYKYVRVK